FPSARLAGAIGGLSAIMAVGSGLGTVIAGPVSALIGWRGLFALPLVLAAVLLSGWLVALLLPLSSGNQWGWGSPIVLTLFVVAAILASAWVAVELRSRNPLVDMKIMRLPAVWTTNVTALLTGAAMFGVWAYLPRLAETPTSSG